MTVVYECNIIIIITTFIVKFNFQVLYNNICDVARLIEIENVRFPGCHCPMSSHLSLSEIVVIKDNSLL